MLVYLDMCCLKRPFDDASQARIKLESDAALALMGAPEDKCRFLHAPAHDLENQQNPLAWRANRVHQWLAGLPLVVLPEQPVTKRTAELRTLGFRGFDAFHLSRLVQQTRVRVVSPVALAAELCR